MADTDNHDRIEAEILRASGGADPFAAAVRATRMPMIITDPTQADNPIVFVNNAFARLTGYSRSEIIGRNCRFLQGPESDPASISRIRDAIARRIPIEIELKNHKKDGEVFWNRLLISPVFDEDGKLTYFFASQYDVSLERDRMVRLKEDRDNLEREIERRTQDLQQSEAQLRYIMEAANLGYWTRDLQTNRLVVSASCKAQFGRAADEPFTYDDLIESLVPEDRLRMQESINAAVHGRADYDLEFCTRHPNGEMRWILARGRATYRSDGTPLQMAGVTLDITDRKHTEQGRDLLTRELNHRVKNSMSTLQSVVRQTLRQSPSLETAIAALDLRMQSMANAHDVLTSENWEGGQLSDIVNGTLAPFADSYLHRFKIGGPRLRLSSGMVLAMSMALHELATNAIKYGSLSNDQGTVIISWNYVSGSKHKAFWLRWEEVEGPPVSPPTRSGFGSKMIERILTSSGGTTAGIQYRPAGVLFELEANLQ